MTKQKYRPVDVIQVELSRPLKEIKVVSDRVFILACFHGSPLGYIMTTSQADICAADDLTEVIVNEFSREILCHALAAWLLTPEKIYPLSLSELVEIPYPAPLPDDLLPLITVAVCTKDRTSLLAGCLEALQEIDYPKLDVLIV
ncbi:MAG: hypothetical protein D3916_14390, partial [Candidatus Electrothrix sp. MAN1_4]|nr:hypothetical protein [Candidatus Electrothrix sp. MAN1_4]